MRRAYIASDEPFNRAVARARCMRQAPCARCRAWLGLGPRLLSACWLRVSPHFFALGRRRFRLHWRLLFEGALNPPTRTHIEHNCARELVPLWGHM